MSTETVSVDGHTITIEINITPSKESKPEATGRTDIPDVIDDYSVAPIKETRSSKWGGRRPGYPEVWHVSQQQDRRRILQDLRFRPPLDR